MAGQLKDLGIGQVRQLSRVQDARQLLEENPHDIVLCELNFDDAVMSGQDLLDELRRENLLPPSTIFIIVTSQATYNQVKEAAESTIDGYLVKPYKAAALTERLQEARRRRAALKPVYEAAQARDFVTAAALAEAHYHEGGSYSLLAARLAAELWLSAQQPQQAARVCSAVNATEPRPWALAGVARASMVQGQFAAAGKLLDALVESHAGYADAHDLRGRVLAEQGEMEPALEAFRASALLTPACLLRMQHCGALAFYLGHRPEAMRWLEKAASAGRSSRLLDVLSLLMLLLLKFDLGDSRGTAVMLDHLKAFSARHPTSPRARRMLQVGQVLMLLQLRKFDAALSATHAMGADVTEPGFDQEAATLLLWLWMRFPKGEVPVKDLDALVRRLGMRFCVSKGASELLAAALEGDARSQATLRDCHARVGEMAETAMALSLAGQQEQTVLELLRLARETGNAKFIDMAAGVARRHAAAIPEAPALQARIHELQGKPAPPLSHIAGMRRSARIPGGVVLRS